MKKSSAFITSIVMALAGVLTLAPQAWASTTYSFDINTNTADGYADAYGTVTFNGSRDFSIIVHIRDMCNPTTGVGDGEGAYAWAEIRYMDGSSDLGRLFNVGFDNNGCGTTWEYFNNPFTNWNKNVKDVRIRLDESNGPSGTVSETVYSTWKDNTYT